MAFHRLRHERPARERCRRDLSERPLSSSPAPLGELLDRHALPGNVPSVHETWAPRACLGMDMELHDTRSGKGPLASWCDFGTF